MTGPTEIQCSDEVFSGLVALFNAIIFRRFPESPIADPDDLHEMADMLQALRPDLPDIAMLYGLVAVVRQDWPAASAIFRSLHEQRLCVPSSDAMLMFCLSSMGDVGWRAIGESLLASDEVQASHHQLMAALIARQDLERATREANLTGVYHEPCSIQALIARRQLAHEVAPGSEAPHVPVAASTYLRA